MFLLQTNKKFGKATKIPFLVTDNDILLENVILSTQFFKETSTEISFNKDSCTISSSLLNIDGKKEKLSLFVSRLESDIVLTNMKEILYQIKCYVINILELCLVMI